jgi:hypothetical protein
MRRKTKDFGLNNSKHFPNLILNMKKKKKKILMLPTEDNLRNYFQEPSVRRT